MHRAQLGMCPNGVEVCGAWGEEVQHTCTCMFSRLATKLSVESSVPKPRSTVKHTCEAEHDAGQNQYKGLAKQSYSRLIVALDL